VALGSVARHPLLSVFTQPQFEVFKSANTKKNEVLFMLRLFWQVTKSFVSMDSVTRGYLIDYNLRGLALLPITTGPDKPQSMSNQPLLGYEEWIAC
jgi:hypothetical protein